ncbi:MAG: anion transporter [Spirochaetales bacterium]|nr:anion transporter [Spirochaetales bacterium]
MLEIFLLVILAFVALGEIPRLYLNRATIALTGVIVLLVFGAVSLKEAFAAIDGNTLVVLFAMMVFTAHLRLAGFFQLAGRALVRVSSTPLIFLALLLLSSAVLSAVFVNDTVALMLTPLVAEVTLAAGLKPIPFLIGLAVSANIGSMTTPIGNPQNILIANSSGLGFSNFLGLLTVPAFISLAVAFLLIALVFRSDFKNVRLPVPEVAVRVFKPLLWKSLAAILVILAGFILGWGLAVSALSGCAVLLFTRRIKPDKVFRLVDWNLLVFFSALFVLTRVLETTPGFQAVFKVVQPALHHGLPLFALLSAALSNLISNVPAVLILRPLIPALAQPDHAWLALASTSTLAGNLTLLGSVANLIVAESAKPYGIRLKFLTYLKIGLPLTVVSLAVTVTWIQFF